jgi:hypothetical protein
MVLAEWLGFSKLCLESDCLGAVAKIKNPEVDRSLHGPLVEEIKVLLEASMSLKSGMCEDLRISSHIV